MSKAPEKPDTENLAGTIERVVFNNAETGFTVLKLISRGMREPVPVIGVSTDVHAGEFLYATGRWEMSRDFGRQFRAFDMRTAPPTSVKGIEKYLASGSVRGIGPVYAKKLVKAFGTRVFDVIENEPAFLKTVDGIGRKRADAIRTGWETQRAVREIMLFLHGHGVGSARAARIYRKYGNEAIRVISDNPYVLARDIRGIGFDSADKIAASIGISKDSPARIRAGLHYTLNQAANEGHCAFPEDGLIASATELLEVNAALVEPALTAECLDGHLVRDIVRETPVVYRKGLHTSENEVARLLATLAEGAPPWPKIDAPVAIDWASKKIGLEPAAGQRTALETILAGKVTVLTGGPGVGKTTILRALLAILRTKGVNVELASPTGRAAKRLTEATKLPARTIHRLLGVDPIRGGFRHHEGEPLEGDLFVIDEASMIDLSLMHSLLRALPLHSGLLLVGDVDQLPSVGPGQVLGDIIASNATPSVRLTEIFRQARESRIIISAHKINSGRMPVLAPPDSLSDFYFVPAETPDDVQRLILTVVKDRIPARFGLDAMRDVQVLTPMNRGPSGTRALNEILGKALNPNPTAVIERFGQRFAIGDKVMQTENDYDKEVFNGDQGIVSTIDDKLAEMTVRFEEREVAYSFDELDCLTPAYAVTIHKSQGSEFPAVVIPLTTSHYPMLARNLLYTAVTRGKGLVVLVGQKKAVAIAVRNGSAGKRWTGLAERIKARQKY
ncbi:MAG: ATP-dependent RecD-like DNA helicase [Pseudomonadota bacterium]|nr:ATP-dependent RecD-like DNA helicase [Pseudomonadota bacterium]